jgi:hypothetical protein
MDFVDYQVDARFRAYVFLEQTPLGHYFLKPAEQATQCLGKEIR